MGWAQHFYRGWRWGGQNFVLVREGVGGRCKFFFLEKVVRNVCLMRVCGGRNFSDYGWEFFSGEGWGACGEVEGAKFFQASGVKLFSSKRGIDVFSDEGVFELFQVMGRGISSGDCGVNFLAWRLAILYVLLLIVCSGVVIYKRICYTSCFLFV